MTQQSAISPNGSGSEARTHWTKQYFQEGFYNSLPPIFKTKVAMQQVALIVAKLKLLPGAHVLDVPCGFGRLLVPLTEKGYRVTGVDNNALYLQYAREALAIRGLNANLVHQDMRSLSTIGQFDGAICYGSSIGYFTPEDDLRFFQCVYRLLKPTARFMIETDGFEWLMAVAPQRNWFSGGNGWFALNEFVERDATQGRVRMKHYFLNPRAGVEQHAFVDIKAYTLCELVDLLTKAGFHMIEASTSEGTPYIAKSARLLVTGQKCS